MRFAILGAGRAGCALHHALGPAGHEPGVLWTRSPKTAEVARADGFPSVSAKIPDLSAADVVVLAVSDGAVARLAEVLAASGTFTPRTTFFHLAGSLDLAPLAPLAARGSPVGSLHPLVSIASRRTPLAGAVAAVAAGDEVTRALLDSLATALGLTAIHPTGDRALYHAAACVVGNYPQVLMEAGLRLFESLGVPREDGQRALGPLLASATRNALERTPAEALTGPIRRGDADVVRRHLDALEALPDPSRLVALYRAAGAIAAELTDERARASVLSVLEGDAP